MGSISNQKAKIKKSKRRVLNYEKVDIRANPGGSHDLFTGGDTSS
jgi:hypothetical protein